MNILLKSAKVICPGSKHHNQVVDIFVAAGQIKAIGPNLSAESHDTMILSRAGMHVAPGFVELHAHFGTPGHEDRETMESGIRAAIAGGFTHVALVADNQPATDNASAVSFLNRYNQGAPIEILPLGALTKGLKGEELSEMYDMHAHGAKAFYDHKKPIDNPNLLKLALQYTKVIEAPVFVHPFEKKLAVNGTMHEGAVSTYLGMHGMPALSEEISIERDLAIREYTGGKLHFAGVSTLGSIAILKDKQQATPGVTADVAFYNLVATHEALDSYDPLWKVNPPLRTESDREALWHALENETLAAISTDHIPWNVEKKQCEFELASFGMAAIENAFLALLTHKPDKTPLEVIIKALSHSPRSILGLPQVNFEQGSVADFTVFLPDGTKPAHSKRQSLAKNDPFIAQNLNGEILGVVYQQFTSLPQS
jgi:dihydroorotase